MKSFLNVAVQFVCLYQVSGYSNGSPSCDLKKPGHGRQPLGAEEAAQAGYKITSVEEQQNNWKVTISGPNFIGILINANSTGEWISFDGNLFKMMKLGGNCVTHRTKLPSNNVDDGDDHDDDDSNEDDHEEDDDTNSGIFSWLKSFFSQTQVKNTIDRRSQQVESSFSFIFQGTNRETPNFNVIIVESYSKYYTGIKI